MKRYLPFIIVALVAIVTVGSGAALYHAKRPPVLSTLSGKVGKDAHVRGNPNASVTLEEYGDFQCPPCGKLSEPLNEIEKEFRGKVRLIFHHFPLINHAHAREAAIAAEAAAEQGKFWEMHDLLYREQAVWSKAPDVHQLFESYAGIVGLDLARFKKDMQSEETKSRVTADQQQGSSLGVQNTPTIFLNNNAVDPKSLNPDALRAAVDAAIKSKPSS